MKPKFKIASLVLDMKDLPKEYRKQFAFTMALWFTTSVAFGFALGYMMGIMH
jgi:hypothetical protein